jgi:small subunit ribosomal protein S2
MAVVSMKALLESGVHFGHRTHKWHPKMKPYIFTERNSIHIIDLQKTVKALEEAYDLVRETVAEGGTVLFVGTKRQAQETILTEAQRCNMPYVTNRWLGGMLTNWRTIRQRINELERLERMRDRGDFARITKKEGLIITRKMDRLEMLLGGIRIMTRLPDLLFVVDVRRESTAIHEANLLEIPVIALVDTNCDPDNVDYVIPSNDDAIRAIKLLVGKIADAVLDGLALRKEEEVEAMPPERMMALVEEPELSDEELLGEATLAKLPSREQEREEEMEEEEIEEEAESQLEQEEEEIEEEAVSQLEQEEESTDEELTDEEQLEEEPEIEYPDEFEELEEDYEREGEARRHKSLDEEEEEDFEDEEDEEDEEEEDFEDYEDEDED